MTIKHWRSGGAVDPPLRTITLEEYRQRASAGENLDTISEPTRTKEYAADYAGAGQAAKNRSAYRRTRP